jgi:hypothetical protein
MGIDAIGNVIQLIFIDFGYGTHHGSISHGPVSYYRSQAGPYPVPQYV